VPSTSISVVLLSARSSPKEGPWNPMNHPKSATEHTCTIHRYYRSLAGPWAVHFTLGSKIGGGPTFEVLHCKICDIMG
jgi:hypothetical protein